MNIVVKAALQAANGQVSVEVITDLMPLLEKGGKKLKEVIKRYTAHGKGGGHEEEIPEEHAEEILEQNEEEVPAEIPEEVREEIQRIAQQYLAERKNPVYMSGVVYFFREPLSDKVRDQLKLMLFNVNPDAQVQAWKDTTCIYYQDMVDTFVKEYMDDAIIESEDYFGMEKDSLYLNFRFDDNKDYFRMRNDEELCEMADAEADTGDLVILYKFCPYFVQCNGF